MFVRELAMFLSGRGMMLGLFVFAARVVMLGLMMVVRCSVVVTSRRVMMLARRMFSHFSSLRWRDSSRADVQSSDIPEVRGVTSKFAQFAHLGNGALLRIGHLP
jgi:hypothetical protein